MAFLLVTFLWPRKEKLLAQARRAGETLSRAQPSRPARRKPCHQQAPPHPQPFSRKGRREQKRSREQAPLPPWEKEAKTFSGADPSPARGEGSKGDLGNRPLSRHGRRRQRLSREQAPLPQGEKGAKTITGTDPSPARGEGSKNDHGSKPLSRMGRRRQGLSRGCSPLPLGEGQGEGIRAPPIWHTPSPATWRRRRRTGSAPGSAGRPLRSSALCLRQISDGAPAGRA